MTLNFSLSVFSREFRKSSGSPPSSSRVKGREVVSSFRFLLKSMHSRLSFFLMPLIF